MNAVKMMARIEFVDREARERAEGIISAMPTPTGGRSWILPVEELSRTLKELADDGFEIHASVKVA